MGLKIALNETTKVRSSGDPQPVVSGLLLLLGIIIVCGSTTFLGKICNQNIRVRVDFFFGIIDSNNRRIAAGILMIRTGGGLFNTALNCF